MTSPIVSLQDMIDAMDVPNYDYRAYLNKVTGEFVVLSPDEVAAVEAGEPIADYPEWQQEQLKLAEAVLDSDDYLVLPSQFDIHEWSIMRDFCYTVADERLRDLLLDRIRGSGAFRRFKDTIHNHGLADDWYAFRDAALERIAVDWLEYNGFSYRRDPEHDPIADGG